MVGQTDELTDNTKLPVAFSNFAKVFTELKLILLKIILSVM
jgi:hypothetical protein